MHRRILVAEDDNQLRSIVTTFLHDEGFEVESAADGHEALQTAGRRSPELLALDVNMPVMDARAVLQAWTTDARLRDIPVLLVSAAPVLSQLASEYQVRSSLAKPFDLDVFGAVVAQLLAHPEPPPDMPTIGARDALVLQDGSVKSDDVHDRA